MQNHLTAYAEDEYGNQTDSPTIYVAPNETVELNAFVTADEMDGLTYEWTDSNGNPVEGAGTTSCTVGPVTEAENYHLEVSDSYGNTASVNYAVRVQNHLTAYAEDEYGNQTDWPTIYTAPNETVELNAFVSADDMDGLTYEWTDSDGNPVEGAGTTSCTVGPVTRSESYTLTVSDPYGNTACVNYDIRIQNHLNAYTKDKYGNETQWNEVYIAPNKTLDLNVTVSADDMEGLTYEWTDGDGNPVEDAGTTSCTVGPVTKNGNYTFTVYDQYGNSVSVYFYIRVQNHLEAYTTYTEDGETQQTNYLTLGVAPNASADLNVTVSADDMEGLTYEWTDSDGDPIEGGDINSCTIGPVTERGSYYFNVFDPYGNSSSVSFEVYVENHLTVYPEGAEEGYNRKTLYAAPGQPLDLNAIVSADETENLTYSWYIEDDPVDGNNQSSYTIDSVTYSHTYKLKVEDPYGNSREAYFEVIVENNLHAYAAGTDEDGYKYVAVTPGESADLKVIASADDMSEVTYTWYYLDDWELTNPIAGAVSDTYHIDSVTQQQDYRCYVEDKYGNKDDVIFYVYAENHLRVYPEGESEDSTEKEITVPYGS